MGAMQHTGRMPTLAAGPGSRAKTEPTPVGEVIIRPPGTFVHLDLPELWRYRSTLWSKVKQRVRLQYDDMGLGLFWAVARPLIMVLVFWAFRGLSQARTGVDIPYVLYVYSGLVAWFYFTEASTAVAMSLSRDAGLIQKVYFPRLISPLSHLLGETYNVALAAVPLVVMMVSFGEYPGWSLLLLPLVLAQLMLLVLGVGMAFSSLILTGRDWERVLQFSLYLGLWVSPVIYSVAMIPKRYELVYLANPMSGTLLALRAALFGSVDFPWGPWAHASAFSVALAGLGLLLFQRSARHLADRL
jgi:lipopolysaccharide transport system permease protein